jgi:hypothetical protein
MFHGLPFKGWGNAAYLFGDCSVERLRTSLHGRVGEVGFFIIGVSVLLRLKRSHPGILPLRVLEPMALGRSRAWLSSNPNSLFNEI